jgi:hypothetical protein
LGHPLRGDAKEVAGFLESEALLTQSLNGCPGVSGCPSLDFGCLDRRSPCPVHLIHDASREFELESQPE